ncbi:MAG: hypothetical protein WC494_00075 [Candidatus Pacearchaeota archaeon]
MKTTTKKVLVFGLLGLFALTLLINFVSAAESPFDPIKSWFADWTGGNLSPNIAKFLFWALVSIVVFAIGSKIPGLNSLFSDKMMWLGAVFSILVGFLSMAYITPEEVFALMTSYSALGFVLGGALPFIILFYFTVTLAMESESKGATQRYMSKLFAIGLWILFTFFIALKIFYPSDEEVIKTGTYFLLTWGLFALGVLCTVSISWMFGKIWSNVKKEKIGKSKDVTEKSTAAVKNRAGETEELGG